MLSVGTRFDGSAAVPAAVRRASPPRRAEGEDALGTAGKMPALHTEVMRY
jgi:hypothetical protein